MLIGYRRVSRADGSQVLDPQRDALLDAAAAAGHPNEDYGLRQARRLAWAGSVPQVAWKLDRLGRGASLDTTTANGRQVFGIFVLAEFERELVNERTKAGGPCAELGITRRTLCRHVDPKGQLRRDGEKRLRGRTYLSRSDAPRAQAPP